MRNPSGALIYPDTLQLAHHPAVAMLTEWQPLKLNPYPPFFGPPVLFALVFVAIVWR